MENHLIGEVVPASDLTPETIAAADVNVVGYSADEGVGAEGGRRRQVRNPESVPEAERRRSGPCENICVYDSTSLGSSSTASSSI